MGLMESPKGLITVRFNSELDSMFPINLNFNYGTKFVEHTSKSIRILSSKKIRLFYLSNIIS